MITNPLNAALSCRDVITAYDSAPRSLNSVVTAFDAFDGRSLGTGVPIYKGKVNTGLPNPYLAFNSLSPGFNLA